MLVQLPKKRDIQSTYHQVTLFDGRIGNYKGSFDDWLARLYPTNTPLMNSKGTVAKAV